MSIEKVTVGIDGSPSSAHLLSWADDVAAQAGGRVQVVLSWRLPYFQSAVAGNVGAETRDLSLMATDVLARVVHAQPRRSHVEQIVTQGGAPGVLLEAAASDDLLVVGRRSEGSLRALGSTSRHCALHAKCPVAVVPDGAALLGSSPAVAVAVDGSPHSIDALAWVLNNFGGADIAAINSQERHDAPATDVVARSVEAARQLATVDTPVQTIALTGEAWTTVLEEASSRDMLVVGDRGHSGVAGLLLGSFASFAIGHAPPPLPVVVVRSRSSA